MKRRRVKITGIGPVTPAGIGREEFWKGILEPVSRVRAYTKLGEEYGELIAASIDRFDIGKFVDRGALPKGAARQTLFAVGGAVLAMRDAAVTTEQARQCSPFIVTGSSIMDFGGIVKGIDAVTKGGAKSARPRTIHTAGIGSVPSAINQTLGLCGRTVAISNHCSSGMDAVGYAAALIENGQAEMALCGGMDAPLNRAPLLELRAGAIITGSTERAEQQVRPFDLWRTMGAIAEGGAMFLLEPAESPRPGYAYVAGYGFANDINDELCSGLLLSGRVAIAHASLRYNQIDGLNAWGPGDRFVDKGEALAMQRLFGPHLAEIPAVSIKGAIGSSLGGSPAAQIAAAACGLKFEAIPPTVNWRHPDPECPLNLSAEARYVPHRWTLVNAHGFAAVNSSMVLERC